MTQFDSVETKVLTLTNTAGEPIVTFEIGPNNDKPQRQGRLQLHFHKNYSAEIEIEPGPECFGSPGNSIIAQIMLWGKRTLDGTGRGRICAPTIAVDGAGGQYGIIDSTTNDPTNSAGQSRAMPLGVNAGEGKGVYWFLYPIDNTYDFQDRGANVSTGRNPFARLVRHLKRIGK